MYTFRDLNLPSCVPAGFVHHQKYVLVLAGSHLFLANSLSAIENSSTLTVGRISQYTSPLSGCTKP